METMVERVARAILAGHDWTDGAHIEHGDAEVSGWDALKPDWQEAYRKMARAAIEAMRPANSAVLQAVSKYAYEGWGDPETIALQAWQSGIDAALSESMKEK